MHGFHPSPLAGKGAEIVIRAPKGRESRVGIDASVDNRTPVSSPATETVLHFLRSQIAGQRGAARLERGAVQFAVTREHDGQTEYWSMLITANDVSLVRGALPLEHAEPIVTLFVSDGDLVRISRGEAPTDSSAEGDRKLLEQITACFRPANTLIGVRQT